MPRPGPRPYECVRRAWHSDTHHPIRGSLIQEIFRIVNEVHSSTTKKNKEWQDNLPIVVLKAEEILYSKANSEAEYSDLKTLWHRVNDAIDTIIRRDESSETGELLQPCIEAALYLGCTPRRSSRSQRNDAPKYYLRPETRDTKFVPPSKTRDTSFVPPSNLDSKLLRNYTSKSQLMFPYSKFMTSTAIDSSFSSTNKGCHNSKSPILLKNLIPSGNFTNEPLQATWSVYPLYYEETDNVHKPDPPNINLPVKLDPSQTECDLSLRLGSPAVPLDEEKGELGNAEEGKSNLSEDFSFFLQAKDKQVCWQLSLNSMKE